MAGVGQMMRFHLDDGPLNILCLGAHPDDIEIGCGGTLLELLASRAEVHVDWVVLAVAADRREEAQCAARRFLENARESHLGLHGFEDGFLPHLGREVKRRFEEMKGLADPDLIFTHWRGDAHQDHRLVNELTWNTFRDHLILEYEIPKYDGDLGRPTLYLPLSGKTLEEKISIVVECHRSQAEKDWFEPEVFRSLARLRGMECRAPEGYAEAFHAYKTRLAV